MPFVESNLGSGEDADTQENKEILVYSRRPKSKYKGHSHLTTKIVQPSDGSKQLEPSFNPSNYVSTDDLPIVLKKQSMSYTFHLISKFVSYDILSPKFNAFTSNLDNIKISKIY